MVRDGARKLAGPPPRAILKENTSCVDSCAISPDDLRVNTTGSDRAMQHWDAARCQRRSRGPPGSKLRVLPRRRAPLDEAQPWDGFCSGYMRALLRRALQNTRSGALPGQFQSCASSTDGRASRGRAWKARRGSGTPRPATTLTTQDGVHRLQLDRFARRQAPHEYEPRSDRLALQRRRMPRRCQ